MGRKVTSLGKSSMGERVELGAFRTMTGSSLGTEIIVVWAKSFFTSTRAASGSDDFRARTGTLTLIFSDLEVKIGRLMTNETSSLAGVENR